MSNEIVVQRQAFSLAPQSLSEAMEFAKMMADSELVPKAFKGKPGDVLIAVQMGAEVGLAPMASIQNIAVINGKPGIYGDAGKAILLASGCVIEEDDIDVIKKTGRARCKITRGSRPPVERTYGIDNAKTAGLWGKDGPWKTNPERQMAWRAFWFAARDAAADLLKGMGGAEELADYTPTEPRDITPPAAGLPPPPPSIPDYPQDAFDRVVAKWRESGTKSPEDFIAMLSTKGKLSDAQIAEVKKGRVIDHPMTLARYDEVKGLLESAVGIDALEQAADLIGDVPDADQRTELTELFRKRRDEMGA